MKIYFCPECGAYDFGDGSVCIDCDEPIPTDSWADLTEEELADLDYADEFELPPRIALVGIRGGESRTGS